ncbi:LysR family transcriptional regulator [Nitrospirillum pindoramense]|uniref:DNA-binding transcriptional LysR family regulator n=1 Tax=Nitrospirillum amazonense TaxID=28077 RepID=A0A560GUK2_9PROT|nr:LysR family transcriptional regulator [Nitrospirillum amazonense]TWB37668.1 DNA-binding transcriptional LysR family regulator [Nitrospirillum amazonense]
MDIRHLRYFTAVAEELHFTRAAEKLGIRQPPLSQQIQQLEREIGSPLFHRLSRGVELTAVGVSFLKDAKAILAQIDQALASARQVARGEKGRLRMGLSMSVTAHPWIARLIRDYRAQHPGVQVTLELNDFGQLTDAVRDGALDVALVRGRTAEIPGLTTYAVVEEKLLAALPLGHRLADAGTLDLAELADEDFLIIPRTAGPNIYDIMIAACRKAGFSPRIVQEVPAFPPLLNLVEAGLGVALAPDSMRNMGQEGVRLLDLKGGDDTAPIMLVYRANEGAAAARALVAQARRAAAIHSATTKA